MADRDLELTRVLAAPRHPSQEVTRASRLYRAQPFARTPPAEPPTRPYAGPPPVPDDEPAKAPRTEPAKALRDASTARQSRVGTDEPTRCVPAPRRLRDVRAARFALAGFGVFALSGASALLRSTTTPTRTYARPSVLLASPITPAASEPSPEPLPEDPAAPASESPTAEPSPEQRVAQPPQTPAGADRKARHPRPAEASAHAAAHLLAAGRYREALAAYRELAQAKPNQPVYQQVARVLQQRLARHCERRAQGGDPSCDDHTP
jgi:hypothetical protein